jgi:hypothetical protein
MMILRHTVSIALLLQVSLVCLPCTRALHAQERASEEAEGHPVTSVRTRAEPLQTPLPDDATNEGDPAEAKKLFLEAKALRDNGKLRAACEAYQRSLAVKPTLATLLNLGYCQRELGNVVTAHDYYRRAEVLATLQGDRKRREAAHDEAAELAQLRATLLLQISNADAGQLEVRIDNVPQPHEVWSRPMYIDAGDHSVSIRAPEHQPFRDHVRIQDGERAVFVVPDLQRLPSAPPRAAELAPAAPSSMVSPEGLALHQSRQRNQAELGAMRIAAFGVGGAGIVSFGVGLLFGQLAKNANDDSKALCTQVCTEQGRLLRETAFAHATRSTVLSVAGGIGIVSGVALWLLAPSPDVPPATTLAFSLSPHMFGPELRGVY